AYSILKTLEYALDKEKSKISTTRASELAQNMYQITIMLPDQKLEQKVLLEMDKEQKELFEICSKYF
ncbi:hypothetical protein, partial [Taylorella equigenitalis]